MENTEETATKKQCTECRNDRPAWMTEERREQVKEIYQALSSEAAPPSKTVETETTVKTETVEVEEVKTETVEIVEEKPWYERDKYKYDVPMLTKDDAEKWDELIDEMVEHGFSFDAGLTARINYAKEEIDDVFPPKGDMKFVFSSELKRLLQERIKNVNPQRIEVYKHCLSLLSKRENEEDWEGGRYACGF